jgi:hypothetical protein
MGYLMIATNEVVSYERILINLLFRAYPHLKKRRDENPEPDLVNIVDKIETLMHIEHGDFS